MVSDNQVIEMKYFERGDESNSGAKIPDFAGLHKRTLPLLFRADCSTLAHNFAHSRQSLGRQFSVAFLIRGD